MEVAVTGLAGNKFRQLVSCLSFPTLMNTLVVLTKQKVLTRLERSKAAHPQEVAMGLEET